MDTPTASGGRNPPRWWPGLRQASPRLPPLPPQEEQQGQEPFPFREQIPPQGVEQRARDPEDGTRPDGVCQIDTTPRERAAAGDPEDARPPRAENSSNSSNGSNSERWARLRLSHSQEEQQEQEPFPFREQIPPQGVEQRAGLRHTPRAQDPEGKSRTARPQPTASDTGHPLPGGTAGARLQ